MFLAVHQVRGACDQIIPGPMYAICNYAQGKYTTTCNSRPEATTHEDALGGRSYQASVA